MAVLGLHFCVRAFSSCGKWGPLFIAVRGPLLLWSTGSRRAGSVIVAHGPTCSAACEIFPDQGSNPCPLHWQADSQPLRPQGSPIAFLFKPLHIILQQYNSAFISSNTECSFMVSCVCIHCLFCLGCPAFSLSSLLFG